MSLRFLCSVKQTALIHFFFWVAVRVTNTLRWFSQLLLLCVSVWFLCFCLRSTFSFQRSILRLSLFLYGNSHPSVFFFLHFFVWKHFSCTHHSRPRPSLSIKPCPLCLKHCNQIFNLGSININPLSSPRRSYSNDSNSCVDETMSQVVPLSPFSLWPVSQHTKESPEASPSYYALGVPRNSP